jgi:hypothetical protein
MPLHCNKENKAGLFEVFYKTFLFLLVLSLAFLSGSQASTIPVGLTFNTANYTQCNTLLIQIRVSKDKSFSNLVDQSGWMTCQPNTNLTYSASVPTVQGNFYWQGRHMNPCTSEVTAWSAPFRFYLLLDPSKLVSGDVNGDSFFTLVDLIDLVQYFFAGGPPPTPPQVGDVNCDGKCTVGDLIYLINYLWKFGPPPCRPYFKPLSLQQVK